MNNFKSFPIILSCYLVPLFVLILLTRIIPDSLNILVLGFIITSIGAFILYSTSEKPTPVPVTAPPIDITPFHEEIAALRQNLDIQQHKEQEWSQKLNAFTAVNEEIDHLKQENESLHKQVQSAVARYRELQDSQNSILQEHQSTIADLRNDLAQRQQMGDQLEGKVRDLSYEIKTLLRLAERPIQGEQKSEAVSVAVMETESDAPVQTREEAHIQLKRSLDIAQRVTGAGYLTNSPKFQEFYLENSALDLRRLSDKLRDIEHTALIVFSTKENKLLFANETTKQLLGINNERFAETFQELIQSDFEPWKLAQQQLAFKNEAHLILPISIRPGEILEVECLLGVIQTGLFRNNIIGLLYRS